ncbi:MAG: ABC transporter ATP-binding protein [Myxococcota bacterium]
MDAHRGLAADGLQLQVGDRRLFRPVSFHVPSGGVLAVTGRSGVVKTSLLRGVCGLNELSAGSVRLDGKRPDEWGWPRFRSLVRYCPQRAAMLRGSVADNLALAERYGDIKAKDGMARLSQLGVACDGGTEASRLSEGERQRLSLVRGLLSKPKVALLDEPTSALDPESRDRVEAWLAELTEGGMIVVLVSHDPEQVRRLATDVLELRAFSPSRRGRGEHVG